MEMVEEKEVEAAVKATGASRLKLTKPNIPDEISIDIFSRLPAKSLLRLKCLSKSWCSVISSSLFATTYLTRTLENPLNRYALLMKAYDRSASERHFLKGSYLGGPTTHLFTLPNVPPVPNETEHVNGLVIFRSTNGYVKRNFAFIINPSIHEVFKLPGRSAQRRFTYGNAHVCYFLGFDPSSDQFKILNTRIIGLKTPQKRKIECAIFNLSSCSWKRIDPVFPFDLMGDDWLSGYKESVCINGVIYIIFLHSYVVAAFDLREEKFSLIPLPRSAIPSEICLRCGTDPYLMDYNGLLAVVCYKHNLVEMWILKDSDNQVWVKETITLSSDWTAGGSHFPVQVICTGEIMFTPKRISRSSLQVPFYDMNQRSYRSTEITLSPEWLASDDIEVTCSIGYIDSILHLPRNH